jgi:hypothetical protein
MPLLHAASIVHKCRYGDVEPLTAVCRAVGYSNDSTTVEFWHALACGARTRDSPCCGCC